MLLCDIGNTSYHFFDTSTQDDYKINKKKFEPSTINTTIYYICVEPNIKKVLKNLKNWIDISANIDIQKYYPTMGIDRIIACEAIEHDGIIIDAGSAITVDIVKNATFRGGFIYPGIRAMNGAYKDISKALDYDFNFNIDLKTLPKNSQDAITYGYLKTFYLEVVSHNLPITITGGDMDIFQSLFPTAKLDKLLLFKGMIKILNYQ
jgi:type III pantothenate kinase